MTRVHASLFCWLLLVSSIPANESFMDAACRIRDTLLAERINQDAAGRALAEGAPPYAEFGAVPLSLLYGFERHLLVCRAEFPASHAYLISRTLDETLAAEPGAALSMADPEGALALHPGSRDYLLGRPLPEAEDLAAGHGQPHDHGD